LRPVLLSSSMFVMTKPFWCQGEIGWESLAGSAQGPGRYNGPDHIPYV